MAVKLSTRDEQLLDGQHGKAAQMAMRILVRMAEVLVSKALFWEILERISHLKPVPIGPG